MNTNEINPTTNQTNPTNPTNPQIPEAYKTLKHKPFRFGDYYFLQEPTPALQQLLNQPTGGFAELISHIFNRTHQSRYTVFPTIYKRTLFHYQLTVSWKQAGWLSILQRFNQHAKRFLLYELLQRTHCY